MSSWLKNVVARGNRRRTLRAVHTPAHVRGRYDAAATTEENRQHWANADLLSAGAASRYRSNSQYAGNSSKAWYLLAEPGDLPVIEVAFLNGQESPTIETADADFSVLGVQMRGYHDFGVGLQDPRGGIKAKGEA